MMKSNARHFYRLNNLCQARQEAPQQMMFAVDLVVVMLRTRPQQRARVVLGGCFFRMDSEIFEYRLVIDLWFPTSRHFQ